MNWIVVYLLIIKIQAPGLLGNWSKREFGKARETNPHNKRYSKVFSLALTPNVPTSDNPQKIIFTMLFID
jgi:hypothetical protein